MNHELSKITNTLNQFLSAGTNFNLHVADKKTYAQLRQYQPNMNAGHMMAVVKQLEYGLGNIIDLSPTQILNKVLGMVEELSKVINKDVINILIDSDRIYSHLIQNYAPLSIKIHNKGLYVGVSAGLIYEAWLRGADIGGTLIKISYIEPSFKQKAKKSNKK